METTKVEGSTGGATESGSETVQVGGDTKQPQDDSSTTSRPSGGKEVRQDADTSGEDPLNQLNASGTYQAENLNLANQQIINNFSEEARAPRLSLKQHFVLQSESHLQREQSRLFIVPDEVDKLVSKLQRHRVLILAGEPETGKATLALAIATSLYSRTEERLREVALCRNLSESVRVDFTDLGQKNRDFHQRVLIFDNAFAGSNEDVLHFVSNLPSLLDSQVQRMHECKSFVLLTADLPSFPGSPDALKKLGILHEVPTPTSSDLARGLQHLAERLLREQSIASEDPRARKIKALISEREPLILGELRSLSRLACFVDGYLLKVAGDEIPLEDALKRAHDLGDWLLEEIPAAPEVWSAVLALTLCSAGRRTEGIPWFEYEALSRSLFRFFRRELHNGPRRGEIRDLCRSERTLQLARATVARAEYPYPDEVQFLDPHYPDRLWQVLLGRGRGLAATLIPLLRQLSADEDPYLQRCAAQALGRIGQIDPVYVTYPLIDQWLSRDEESAHGVLRRGALLGQLFAGILGAKEDPGYQQGCLQILHWLAAREETASVETVLYALHDVAALDRDRFEFTFCILQKVAEKRLQIRWKPLRDIAKTIREVEEGIRKRAAFDTPEGAQKARDDLRKVRKRAGTILNNNLVARNDLPILYALQHILARWLVSYRLRKETLRAVLGWLQADPERFGPLVAFLFLGQDGISTWLERAAPVPRPGHVEDEGDPILESIHADRELAESFRAFLETIFVHIRAFPGLFRDLLEERFVHLLAAWARAASPIGRLRSAFTDLLAGLFASRDEELSARILRLAQELAPPPEMVDLRTLAVEAITRRRPSRSMLQAPLDLST
jgi:DNA polymerase III delta prime subunit